ncbi:hypothetical protein VNO78_33636 [Psophocarpus tetragonolobus]|uniref:Uncharacterized protein n=1 Tax=Psophocarpus tetragonolobus TaxID=3891 RepID=A0AAN9P1I4_PSOTE
MLSPKGISISMWLAHEQPQGHFRSNPSSPHPTLLTSDIPFDNHFTAHTESNPTVLTDAAMPSLSQLKNSNITEGFTPPLGFP